MWSSYVGTGMRVVLLHGHWSLTQVLSPEGPVVLSDSNTAMVDQLVSIVQHVVDTNTEGALEHLAHVNMDDLVLNFIL